jgi:hypothetical protein
MHRLDDCKISWKFDEKDGWLLMQSALAAIKLHKHRPKRARWQGLAVEANVGRQARC